MFPASTFPHRQTCTPWGGLFLPESISPGDETWAANLTQTIEFKSTSIRSRFSRYHCTCLPELGGGPGSFRQLPLNHDLSKSATSQTRNVRRNNRVRLSEP